MHRFQPDPLVTAFDSTRNEGAVEQKKEPELFTAAKKCAKKKDEIGRAAYYFRILSNPADSRTQTIAGECQANLALLARDNPTHTGITYHNLILKQNGEELQALFAKNPSDFLECLRKYDLHHLAYEPWLKEQLSNIAQVPFSDVSNEQVRLFLHVLRTLATLQDLSGAAKKAELQKAAEYLVKVVQSKAIGTLREDDILRTCLQLNYEISLLPAQDIKPIDLHAVMERCYRCISLLFDERHGFPAILKSAPAMDAASKAILESYTPHTRRKAQSAATKPPAEQKKADLFDLMHYVVRDRKKSFRLEERRQLRQVTYDLLVITLAKSLPKSEKEETKEAEPDIKPTLERILDRVLKTEKLYETGEFAEILEGLLANLDQVILEYQYFRVHFLCEVTEQSARTDLYKHMYQQLDLPTFPKYDKATTAFGQCKIDQDYRRYFSHDETGGIPLHHAVAKGDMAGVSALLSDVAPYTQLHTRDTSGKLAKDHCLSGSADMLQVLTEYVDRADLFDYWVYIKYKGTSEEHDYLLSIMLLIAKADKYAQTHPHSKSNPALDEAIRKMHEAAEKTKTLGIMETEHTRILKGMLNTFAKKDKNEENEENKPRLLIQFDKLIECFPEDFWDLVESHLSDLHKLQKAKGMLYKIDGNAGSDEKESESDKNNTTPGKDDRKALADTYDPTTNFFRPVSSQQGLGKQAVVQNGIGSSARCGEEKRGVVTKNEGP